MREDNNDPITGVFIFGKEIQNNGKISSEGTRPITHITTDKYSGEGVIESKQIIHIEKWHKTWWGNALVGLLVTVIGGFILFLLINLF